MTKLRVFLFILTFLIVGSVGTTAFFYAKGYRFDFEKQKLSPSGLLVMKSVPDGAQVFVNGEFKLATNANLSLEPGTYDVIIEKEGFIPWKKRLTIEKEAVTEVTAHLFKSAPSLTAITYSGSINPTPSRDFTKISYIVQPDTNENEEDKNGGLWIMEMLNLPLGFTREPRRVTDGNLTDASWEWSPDGREILLTTQKGAYLLKTGEFTPQSQRINLSLTKDKVLSRWEEEKQKRFAAQIKRLPEELESILAIKTSSLVFSPDGDMIAYVASGSATIPDELIKPIPGASTQKQERQIQNSNTYVYDIEEDRNFLIDDNSKDLTIEGGSTIKTKRILSWFPTSRHLVLAEDEKITIMDYDGTNRHTVYVGSYNFPFAFSTLSIDRLIILTNLGADTMTPNLYSLGLK